MFPFNKAKNEVLAKEILKELIKKKPKTFLEAEKIKNECCEKEGVSTISNTDILRIADEKTPQNIRALLQKRKVRTESGVAVITILTKPYPCRGRCVFCPQERADEKGNVLLDKPEHIPEEYKKAGKEVMPKSYFSNEPAASRALMASFNPYNQVASRLKSLKYTGHNTSKIELIILGGTFSDLPKDYREEFITQALKALNEDSENAEFTLEEAQKKNENTKNHCIAIVAETRPDCIDADEVRFLRYLGCTKVEMGLQSTHDDVLKLCKRGHDKQKAVYAMKILRDAGFKIALHMMPGLPGSSYQKDIEMFKEVFGSEDFCPDFIKIYPCSVVPFSELAEWHKEGKYQALSEEKLFPLLLEIKKMCPPFVRISRLVRDIPSSSILGGSKKTNMRQDLQKHMKENGEKCHCIRCREIKSKDFDASQAELKILEFKASDGKEFFLSFETENNELLALLRLRIPGKNSDIFPELASSGIIRELHTYGRVAEVGEKEGQKAQHAGLGTRLVQRAEEIVQENGFSRLAVISGIGVKEFWRKRGYIDEGYYLTKNLS